MALICRICGYKQYDEDTILAYRKKIPCFEEHDIPYVCGACLETNEDEARNYDTKTVEIYYSDLSPEAQRRLLKGYGMKDPKEGNWDVFPVFVLYPELDDLPDLDDCED